jgi:hypothetical protein
MCHLREDGCFASSAFDPVCQALDRFGVESSLVVVDLALVGWIGEWQRQ